MLSLPSDIRCNRGQCRAPIEPTPERVEQWEWEVGKYGEPSFVCDSCLAASRAEVQAAIAKVPKVRVGGLDGYDLNEAAKILFPRR